MRRKTFARMNCSIARALELVGEWWTMLILREAFLGTQRFHDFQQNLGIARNILSARLKKLVARGILERIAAPGGGRRFEYRLTTKGRAFFPVLMALMQWGDHWSPDAIARRSSRRSRVGRRDSRNVVTSCDGRPLGPSDVMMVPGPGAAAATRERLTVPKTPVARRRAYTGSQRRRRSHSRRINTRTAPRLEDYTDGSQRIEAQRTLGKLVGDLGAAAGAALVVIGDKLGLFRGIAEAGSVTSTEFAKRTGCAERYVREWLAQQAAAGYIEYHASEHVPLPAATR